MSTLSFKVLFEVCMYVFGAIWWPDIGSVAVPDIPIINVRMYIYISFI